MHQSTLPHMTWTLVVLLGAWLIPLAVHADAKDPDKKAAAKPEGTVGGLLIDVQADSIIVQLDDDDEPTKFLYGPGITQQGLLKHNIFGVDRVNVKYKTDGDDKKAIGVEKVNGKQTGVIVGKVLKVYNNFWVAVKPATGMIEGFALNGPPDKTKAQADILKSLNPGDQVAIKYATDFERHRIIEIQVKPAQAK